MDNYIHFIKVGPFRDSGRIEIISDDFIFEIELCIEK